MRREPRDAPRKVARSATPGPLGDSVALGFHAGRRSCGRLEAIRAAIIRGILFGTPPEKLAFAYGGKGRWLLWLPWRWAASGWILCGKDRALSGACPGSWELVEVKDAPATVRRAYAGAMRKWNAVRKDRWPA